MTGALDDSMLVAEILLERANELSTDPTKETVILVGHGPNNEKENRLWLNDMEKLAWFVHGKGGFKEVRVATWRSDAPKEIRDRAIQELRTMVQTSGKEGTVIVVPHLLSSGGVEGEIVNALKGLAYVFNGKTLLPHGNITRWL
ncbi:MAG: sirohydrochlorin chelatase [Candidatus Brocadia sp.]